jgi:P27 family predicted phage terminase small subunit
MAAPTRRPAGLRLLNGRGEGRDSGGRVVTPPPPFKRHAAAPPTWLCREAAAEWRRVVPGLERLEVLKPEDRAALTVYCETWARFVAAVRQYRAEGMVVTNPDSGRQHQHPAVSIATAAASQLRAFAAEFGLTPAAEHRLNAANLAAGDDENNPFSG